MGKVLVVDDDPSVQRYLLHVLSLAGHTAQAVASAEGALGVLQHESFDVVLLDLRLPGMDGLGLLRHLREHARPERVVVLTACVESETAVRAMKAGAQGYLTKPCSPAEVLAEVDEILMGTISSHTLRTAAKDPVYRGPESLIGEHPSMQRVRQLIQAVAGEPASVLIRGETGTGKELVAEAIHALSSRVHKPLVRCNCPAFPEGTLESELFGHVRGAFTGAIRDRKGCFEEAHGGTLFLDEIGDLHPEAQVRLLRVLQEGEFQPVGSTDVRRVDVRVVAATHQDLEAARRDGRFREDLYHRVNGFTIAIPPLRERRSDLPLLCDHLLRRCRRQVGRRLVHLDPAAVEALQQYDWPGNVRELENVLRAARLLANGDTIGTEHVLQVLAEAVHPTAPADATWVCIVRSRVLAQALREAEEAVVRRALQDTGGNISQASRQLRINRRTLQRKTRDYGINSEALRQQ